MAGKSKRRNWFLPPWQHARTARRAKAKLRAIHGDLCWLCGHEMRFEGPPNCGKAATIEHLMPRARGGGWEMDNLRLCHVGCNRHLGDRTPEEKERIRIKRMRPAARIMRRG